jgi:hypothetical protein
MPEMLCGFFSILFLKLHPDFFGTKVNWKNKGLYYSYNQYFIIVF